ncbi:Unknown protein sequence [Pseudomonas amygdali pv. myricae]|nr:Unknown protein sequence [Pseudomonas amygdali pv. myricae]
MLKVIQALTIPFPLTSLSVPLFLNSSSCLFAYSRSRKNTSRPKVVFKQRQLGL